MHTLLSSTFNQIANKIQLTRAPLTRTPCQGTRPTQSSTHFSIWFDWNPIHRLCPPDNPISWCPALVMSTWVIPFCLSDGMHQKRKNGKWQKISQQPFVHSLWAASVIVPTLSAFLCMLKMLYTLNMISSAHLNLRYRGSWRRPVPDRAEKVGTHYFASPNEWPPCRNWRTNV